MSESLCCPHCGRVIPPAFYPYTFIRFGCECGGLFCIIKNGGELTVEAREGRAGVRTSYVGTVKRPGEVN